MKQMLCHIAAITEDYEFPEPLNKERKNIIRVWPKYSTECTGNSKYVKALVKKTRDALNNKQVKLPHFFVGIGNSGMGLASVLSYEFNKPLIYIRKGHIPRNAFEALSIERVGHPNIVARARPQSPENLKWAADRGIPNTPYLGKTFWFVDDCIDSGDSFRQAVHICTVNYGMICSGIALTGELIRFPVQQQIKELALLKNTAPLTILEARHIVRTL